MNKKKFISFEADLKENLKNKKFKKYFKILVIEKN